MKKSILTFLILISLALKSFGQTTCDITNHYADFIQVQKFSFNGKDILIKKVVETETKSCFSDLVNNNTMFVDYLLTNFSSNANVLDLLKETDSLTLCNNYFTYLKEDSLFNAVMIEFVSKTIEKKTPKDTISMDGLLNIAVKYFSILKINEEGYYMAKVCVGQNDIKKTEKDRKPFVEAFSFSSISKHYEGEEFNMYNEFVKAIKELYKVNLGTDKEERLLRAQGAMFLLMRNNENLKKMLKSEYEINKDYLPFVLYDK